MMRWEKLLSIAEMERIKVNEVRSIQLTNKRICFARLSDGFYALDDKCPHAQGSLGEGKCDNEENVICPSHRYKYDIKTGKGKQGDYVNAYPVELREDGLYIGLMKKWWQIF